MHELFALTFCATGILCFKTQIRCFKINTLFIYYFVFDQIKKRVIMTSRAASFVYRGPLRAAILDWSGTTADKYTMAPAVGFVEVFKMKGVSSNQSEETLHNVFIIMTTH